MPARAILTQVRGLFTLGLLLMMAACGPPQAPPVLDGGPGDSGGGRDTSTALDGHVETDGGDPNTAALGLRLRVRTNGDAVEEAGDVELPQGNLTRFDIGVAALAFEGDRPMAPVVRDVGTLSFLTGPRMVTAMPAAPGLYSGVEFSLASNAGGEALAIVIQGASQTIQIETSGPLRFELRCEEDGFDLGVGQRLELPVYADLDGFNEEVSDLSDPLLAELLEESLTLACDEATSF